MTMGGQLAHHDFAVDKIFGATEAYETDFQKGKPNPILAGGFLGISASEAAERPSGRP